MKQKYAALLLMAVLAVPAVAQSSSGVVVSSSTNSVVVRMDDGTQRTFNVTRSTILPPDRLAEGNRVTVQYRPLDGGLFEASSVTIATSPASTADRSMTPATTAAQRDPAATSDTPTPRNAADDGDTLPSTASPMPLLALTGLASLVAGIALKARRNA
jgi:hypothetical protein